MPRDPSRPTWSPRFAREMSELRANQAVKRGFEVLSQHDLQELSRLQRLAHELWGDRGFVELHCGIKTLGYFVDGYSARQVPGRDPGPGRPRVEAFHGASYAEIHAQVRKWKTSTTT